MLHVFLPDELITEILSFLPVRYLMRLKCVCKSWQTLISNPTFVKLHLKHSAGNKHLAIFSNTYRGISYIPMHRLLENTSLTIANDPYFDDHGHIYPIGSYNGLICLFIVKKAESLLYLWNPATRSLCNKVKVYPHSLCPHWWNYGFGYDNSTGTYKIVSLCQSSKEVRVLSIGDNIWRNIQSFPDAHITRHSGVYANGSLNWLTIRKPSQYENWENITNGQFVIFSLDLSTETHRPLLPPWGFDKVPLLRPKLDVLMDSLCFSYDFNKTDLIIWQMKQFGVQDSWIQFLKISYQSLPINIRSSSILFPLYFSENCDTLILAWKSSDQAILYNLRDNTVEEIRITNKVRLSHSMVYVESLVQLVESLKPHEVSTPTNYESSFALHI